MKISPEQFAEHFAGAQQYFADIAKDGKYFAITNDSKQLKRLFEIHCKSIGHSESYKRMVVQKHKDGLLARAAEERSSAHLSQYRELFSALGQIPDMPPELRVLLLSESLARTITRKPDVHDGDKVKTYEQKRVIGKSLEDLPTYNQDVLQYIIRNAKTADGFVGLYLGALEDYREKQLTKQWTQGEDSQALGHWIRFPSREKDADGYKNNALKVQAIAQGTPWCLRYDNSTYLEKQDIYYFMGKDKKPHLAAAVNGKNDVTQLRGIASGQGIEEEYKPAVTELYKNNPHLNATDGALGHQEYLRELDNWTQQLSRGTLSTMDCEKLIAFMLSPHFRRQRAELLEVEKQFMVALNKNTSFLKYFGTKQGTIGGGGSPGQTFNHRMGQMGGEHSDKRIWVGDVGLTHYKGVVKAPLQVVIGDVDVRCGSANLNELETVFRNVRAENVKTKANLSKLSHIYGNFDCNGTQAKLCSRIRVDGNVTASPKNIERLSRKTTFVGDGKFVTCGGVKAKHICRIADYRP